MKEWKDVEIVEIGVEETEHGGPINQSLDWLWQDGDGDLHVDFDKVS